MTYQLYHGGVIVRSTDSAIIPRDPANADYQAFLAWEALGNIPGPIVSDGSPAAADQGY